MAKIKKHWEKKTPFGNWENTPDRQASRTNAQVHIVREAKALGIIGRHGGSKPLNKLLKSIARAHKVLHPTKPVEEEAA